MYSENLSINNTQTLTGSPVFSNLYLGKGVNRLFQDLHILSLIWTHPWCLKLAHLNKNKVLVHIYWSDKHPNIQLFSPLHEI